MKLSLGGPHSVEFWTSDLLQSPHTEKWGPSDKSKVQSKQD